MKKRTAGKSWDAGNNLMGSLLASPVSVLPSTLNGIHGGMNGGRSCWMVTGTMCGNKIQGSYGFKAQNCSQCGFFNQVIKEEGNKFAPPETLLTKNKKTV